MNSKGIITFIQPQFFSQHLLHVSLCALFTFALTYTVAFAEPTIFDEDYKIEQIVSGLSNPTSFTFVDEHMLVTEKDGKILKVSKNGQINDSPILTIPTLIPDCPSFGDGSKETSPNCDQYGEAGLLGITSFNNDVFVFYTHPKNDNCDTHLEKYWPSKNCDIKNLVVKYEFNNDQLTWPKIIKELPVCSIDHHGGAITTSPNGEIYFITGDSIIIPYSDFTAFTHCDFDSVGSVYKHTPKSPESRDFFENLFCDVISIFPQLKNLGVNCSYDVEKIGKNIRNSFGLAVDPKTEYLWQTENGPDRFDEINLITPKFNSGWLKKYDNFTTNDFGAFKFSEPEFAWEIPIGVTGIEFPSISVGFEKYEDYLFVGDYNNGNVYKFHLNQNRDGFILTDEILLNNKIDTSDFPSFKMTYAGDPEYFLPYDNEMPYGISESEEILFIKGISGGVVDITFHDNEMYVLSIGKPYPPLNVPGSIYKISQIIDD